MTLAVVAKAPWGPTSIRGGYLIFAADTRWSFPDSPHRAPEDFGQKLRPITPDIGAVFAGDVRAAEEGLERFEQGIRRERPIQSRQALLDIAQAQFTRVLQAHELKRSSVPPREIYYLVGTRYPTGQTEAIYFESSNRFVPKLVGGVNAIGWPSAAEKFRANLSANEELQRSRGGINEDPTVMGMHLASSLNSVIEDIEEKYVGGGVQWAILDGDGWQTMTVDISLDGEEWKRITKDATEVERSKRRYRMPCLSNGHPDVGLIHICD